MLVLQAEGTLKPWEYFNAERDCEALRAAMKGVGKLQNTLLVRVTQMAQELCIYLYSTQVPGFKYYIVIYHLKLSQLLSNTQMPEVIQFIFLN